MPNSELVGYIAKQKSAGIAPEEVVNNLKSVGWSDQDIADAMGGGGLAAPVGSDTAGRPLKGVMELFKEAWSQFCKQWKTLIGISLVPTAAGFVLALIVFGISLIRGIDYALNASATGSEGWAIIIIQIVVGALIVWSQIALIAASLNPSINLKVAFKQTYRLIPSFAWISLLAVIGASFGLLLLVVPGIVLSVWWMFANYILVAENIRGTKALGRSRAYVRGRWWKVAGRVIGYGIIMMIPVVVPILIGVGLYVAGAAKAVLGVVIIIGIVVVIVYPTVASPFGILYVSALYRSLRATAR